jgi:hypothetical protein
MLKGWVAFSLLLSLSIILAACGQVDPSGTAPGSAGFAATGVAGRPVATGGGPSGALAVTPADDSSYPVNIAIKAAIAYAKATLGATHPSAAEAAQGLFDPTDPKSNVWVVRLVGDTFQLPPCPPGNPQTTYARSCGSGTQARLGLRINDHTVVDVEIDSLPGTPTTQLPITLPPNAKLPTREAAIEAMLKLNTSDGSKPPHLVSADLILAGQDSRLGDVPPDTPIWRIALDQGEFPFSCPPYVGERLPCYSTAITIWVDAVTGLWHAATYGFATPTP